MNILCLWKNINLAPSSHSMRKVASWNEPFDCTTNIGLYLASFVIIVLFLFLIGCVDIFSETVLCEC